jgi:hypothetical protein
MGILDKIQSLLSKKSEPTPLQIHDSAIQKINSQISSRPPGIKSIFQIKLVFLAEKINYQVGFTEDTGISTIFQYPVPILFSKIEELFLRNYTLEFDEKAGMFLLFPDINIETESTPSPTIIKFFINKDVFSIQSSQKEIAIDKSNLNNFDNVLLIKRLFKKQFIDSIFITNRCISVEFNSKDELLKKEEEIADTILKYYTDIGYELELINNFLKTNIPEN